MALVDDLLPRCSFPEAGVAVTCAVSGGADSSALLVLAVHAGCGVTAVHVDHGLRDGSSEEAAVVAALAERFGASFVSRSAEVEPGPNLEARAREARRSVLPTDALLGHTADDQVETVLLNLLRGAGLDGLAGIRHDARHPILGLRRRETAALCDELGIVPVDDPSNRDLSLRRNRVRHELLPLLDAIAERDVVPVIARQAELLRDAADELDRRASALDPVDARALADAEPVLARQALRGWLRACSPDLHPPSAATLERVLDVARGRARATEVSGGWRVERHGQRLSLVR